MTVEQLIIDKLDLWTSATTHKATSGRGRNGKLELTGLKKLRELILELAVRGKLVPQDPNDEPASVLLEKIAAEKARLVKEGKIKKPKVLPEIAEDEKPFELPEGWEWAYLENIGRDWGQKTPNKPFSYIDVASIDNAKGLISSPTVLSSEEAPSRARKLVQEGTLIYSTVRPYLQNIAVVDIVIDPEPIASTAFAIIYPLGNMPPRYFLHYLRSPTFVNYVESVQTGIAYPAINDKQFFSGLAPIPPLAEQQRIVEKVDELMGLCDRIENHTLDHLAAHETLVDTLLDTLTQAESAAELADNWGRLADHFDTLFTTEQSIDRLKQTILQLAVMGRLVPQDPTDEPASVLLEKIAAEKARLVKEGKIKKPKVLDAIGEDEKPFEVPDGWLWERIGTFALVGTGATPARDRPDYYVPEEIAWVTSGETSQEAVFSTKEKISRKAVEETNVTVYPPGTLIVAMYRQGKTRGQITELKIHAGTNQACAAIQLVDESLHHKDYIKLFFQKSYEELREHAAGGAQPNLNVGKISHTPVSLPPLAEQHRIVQKVDALMALCDQLKARLAQADDTRRHLAEAVVDQAIQ
ncbi:restriction endonuclease subunit S [Nodosilinea sp. LEGE 07088]|uniref:restriction endonuclease subunit S n=1 Tax=Nodosilinea sp. LEGE 07088 TaxID=2777968 RepID=UPI00187E07AE|nr:restriction endonuclease subunit S [Nodosilinea sp. LEGE 07088]MBE9139874.1 restriction endonuclease subunit S [Nodosilinea sp. LEGE 07088]